MKILVVTPFFYPHVGGSESYMEELYESLLKKHPEIEVNVLCYNTDASRSREKYKGLTIYRIPCFTILPNQFCLPNPIDLMKFLLVHRNDYNLIHCSTRFFDSSWWAPLYAKLVGKKIILTDHCAGTPAHTNPFLYFFVKYIDILTGSVFLPLYDTVFVVSEATRVFLKKTFGTDSKVMYGGADEFWNAERGARLLDKRGKDEALFSTTKKTTNRRVKVVYAGRMIPAKGILDLFEVATKMPGVDFVFAGPGELEEPLKKKVIQNKCSHIKIAGKLGKSALAKLFNTSDIFVYPSYHKEGVPMALLAAGACQLGVVAADSGGIKEVIVQGKTGILVKPKDTEALRKALENLVKNKELRQQLGRNLSIQVKKKFNWQKASGELYREIKTLIA